MIQDITITRNKNIAGTSWVTSNITAPSRKANRNGGSQQPHFGGSGSFSQHTSVHFLYEPLVCHCQYCEASDAAAELKFWPRLFDASVEEELLVLVKH